MIYRMLRNPYYTGRYEFPKGSSKWIKGDYEPLVSKELFEEVQKLLDIGPKPAWGSKDFTFIRMMICGGCGSGITAEEKHKKLKDGSIRRYVYYRCTHAKNLHCKEPSIREDELIQQLSELIDDLDLDMIGMKTKLEDEIKRYQKFTHGVLGQKTQTPIQEIDIKTYAKYIMREGTKMERRELLGYFLSPIVLAAGSITLHPEKAK